MLRRNIDVKVTLLSDLHIGTGVSFIQGLDWIKRADGYVYFANHAAVAEEVLERAAADGKDEREVVNTISGMTLDDLVDAGWLDAADFHVPSPQFFYRLRGTPASTQIREQVKTVYRQLYLPGSSLKGALRTVIATVAANELQPDVSVGDLGRRRTWAAQSIERVLFGKDPSHDFLRMLQVSDSAPIDLGNLRLRQAHIYPTASRTQRGRSRGLDIDLETVAEGAEFSLQIHMPLELLQSGPSDFDARRHQELQDWERRLPWLSRLAAHGREYARQLLIEEVTYFQPRTDVPAVHGFYNDLATRFSRLKKNQFLLPLGWGTGWHTKTLNQYLKKDAKNFEAIAGQYRLDPTGDRKPGDRFPKSRHLLRQPNGQAGKPLGWCLVELRERQAIS